MRLVVVLSLVLVQLLVVVGGVGAEAGGEGRVVVVLDASGSMRGKVGGRVKMEVAKEVVRDLVRKWDSEKPLGLTVYGHRRKDDCGDIEAVVPVGAVDVARIEGVLQGIDPKGMTPLSDAVVKAAEELSYTEEKATVILVSDGVETCSRNPCDIGSELKKSGVDFTAHVIGFDVSKPEELAQLKCLAANTGGQFFNAKDAVSLRQALDSAVKVAVKETGVKLEAVLAEGGEPLQGAEWKIYPADLVGVESGEGVVFDSGAPMVTLAPGRYVVEVKADGASGKREILVAEGKVVTERVVLGAGTVKFVARTMAGGAPLEQGVVWSLYAPRANELGEREKVGDYYDLAVAILPAGRYFTTVSYGKGKVEREIEVVAGKVSTEDFLLGTGTVKFVASLSAGGAPLEGGVVWGVYGVAMNGLGERERVDQLYDVAQVTLPAGRYFVEVTQDAVRAEREIEVVAGRDAIESFIVVGGRVRFVGVDKAGGAPVDDVMWTIEKAEPNGLGDYEKVADGNGSLTVTLPPARYRVSVVSGERKGRSEIEVKPGVLSRAEVVVE